MSLVFKLARNFTRRNIQILMLEDFPSVGFEGQVVQVKPGFARTSLIPRNLAVYNFPGTRERLFPNIRQADIDQKSRFYRDLTNFQNKIDNINLEFQKVPSFANPALLKEEISKKDIIRDVHNKHGIELKPENIVLDENITRFGTYAITVKDYLNTELQKKFEFSVNIQVKQPTVRESREDKALPTKDGKSQKDAKVSGSTSKDAKAPAKESKGTKEGKGGKNAKEGKDAKEKGVKGSKKAAK